MNIAIITGGASGIGLAAAEQFGRAGWPVLIGDLDTERLSQAKADLSAKGVDVTARPLDVSDPASVDEFFTHVDEAGTIGTLLTSAGITFGERLVDLTFNQWNRAIAINLTGTFLCAQRAARRMSESGGGSITTIASISAMTGTSTRCAYAASKGGIVALTRTMATELGEHGIRVNCIVPGNIETPMTEVHHKGIGASIGGKYLGKTPLGRYGKPTEVAAAAVFLASETASYISGEMLHVDGGYTATGMIF